MKSVCFTVHRPSKLIFGYNEESSTFKAFDRILRQTIVDLCYSGYRRFYTGMAEGTDIWAAEIVVGLLNSFYYLELYAVLPYPGHTNKMSKDFKNRYDHILKFAKKTICVSDKYSEDCFKRRNYYMVNHCEKMIAVYDPNQWRSGTGQTVRYAERKGKDIIFINPNHLPAYD